MKKLWVGILLLCSSVFTASSSAESLDAKLAELGANVIFIRHALAPGFGDPDNFDIKDCSTQRNLNNEGRRQARALGEKLRATGLSFDAVLTSQWCRCVDTADLLDLGKVEPFSGLNSFFQGYADRQATLEKLRAYLDNLPTEQRVVLVTHQVVISAITGISPQSGGMVLFNPSSKQAGRFSFN